MRIKKSEHAKSVLSDTSSLIGICKAKVSTEADT